MTGRVEGHVAVRVACVVTSIPFSGAAPKR